jgi:valyl-tRNA synthetase
MPEEMVVQERARVAREMEAKKRLLASIEAKLSNPQFTDRAPPEVVERERARAEEARTALAALEKRLASFG